MLPILDEVIHQPRLERMHRFMREREAIATQTARRTIAEKLADVKDRAGLEIVLNDVCYHESQRFRTSRDIDINDEKLRGKLNRLRKGLRNLSESELRAALEDLVRAYVDDINGNFNPAVFMLASRVVPVGLSLLFSPLRLGRSLADLGQLRERVLIEGQTADLERLAQRGTVVLVPTHLSNLDSIVIGFALERAGLPPVTYGAGKNLWSNPILGFFMRHLGAYRVDRRIKAPLYKDVLKTYSTVLLERGYHSLFFPGGTRSRSGAIESHLKLGLAGTAITATVNLFARGEMRPLYFVPATINYHLVLEAATLIDDFLQEAGKSRYIIEDDESAQITRVARYLRDMLRSGGSMTIQFGEPLDVLGHRIGPDGESYDDRGRRIELRPFFTVGGRHGPDGEIRHDAARDAEYTRELGERIVRSFHAETHVLSTHLVAFALHRMLMRAAGGKADLFRVLRGEEHAAPLPVAEVLATIGRVQQALHERARRRELRLGSRVATGTPQEILDEALGYFTLFHQTPAVRREARPEGECLLVEDRPLCYYYHNRLISYGLEGVA
jgi:glycerol-3-phosphate O-acyltransferase